MPNIHTSITPVDNNHITHVDPSLTLKLTEIFYSLQGEALASGQPTIFIRLTGCPLRCVYCDTTYSFKGGERVTLEHIIDHIQQYPCKRICLTGGEPLAQKNAIALMQLLLVEGYEISLETAGALSVKDVPIEVSKVMDLKTPSSGEERKNLWDNINYLTQHDQLKLVIMNRADYQWAKQQVIERDLLAKVGVVWFSPMFNIEDERTSEVPSLATELAEWILADGLDVRMQLQLHKIIWADAKGK